MTAIPPPPVDTLPTPEPLRVLDSLELPAVLGHVDYARNDSFALIEAAYTERRGIYLHRAAYRAFQRMHRAAAADSVDLTILSAARSFDYQRGIWERKWKKYADLPPRERALKILEFSSMPGTSRHHWGTDIDLNNLNNDYFAAGVGERVYAWLRRHAGDYGFHQVYSDKATDGRTGYNLERWHWSYLPVAEPFRKAYNARVSYAELTGFAGAEVAGEIDVIAKYVNGIDLP